MKKFTIGPKENILVDILGSLYAISASAEGAITVSKSKMFVFH